MRTAQGLYVRMPTFILRALLVLLCAAAGVLTVRLKFLDRLERLVWNIAWDGATSGRPGSVSVDQVLASTTFQKTAAGAAVGAFAGLLVGLVVLPRRVRRGRTKRRKR